MKDKLLIIGASGHGKVVADIALKMKKWKSIGFLDDNSTIKSSLGLSVIDKSDNIDKYITEYDVFVGIGNNETRKKVSDRLETMGATIPVLIHPSAIIGEEVCIENGTVIMAGVIINPSTSIGKGCIINTGSTVDHDNTLGNFVHVSPGSNLAGSVTIGECSWIGAGSVVSNNIKITGKCTIGAGSVVIRDINEDGVYVGAPVRRL